MRKSFIHFRLSLLERRQGSLFASQRTETREDFLRRVFASNFQFPHRGNTFHYVSDGTHDGFMFGRIGRETKILEPDPSNDFHEVPRPAGRVAYIVLDPADHEDGQVIAVEKATGVGTPAGLMQSLASHINLLDNGRFSIAAETIFDPQSFRNFVNSHRGQVVSVKFEFIAPNQIFGSDDSFEDEMRRLKQHTRLQKLRTEMRGDEGLDTDAEEIENGVKYAQKGRGTVTAKTKTGERYSSSDSALKTTISLDLKKFTDILGAVISNVRRLMDRE